MASAQLPRLHPSRLLGLRCFASGEIRAEEPSSGENGGQCFSTDGEPAGAEMEGKLKGKYGSLQRERRTAFPQLRRNDPGMAETELRKATMDVTRTTRHLEEITDNFEKQKIKDIKTVFSEFITIEMLLHRKALEVYTAAYQNIQKIVEDD
ncbi:hypothetical protein E5288_WYG005776 [Bos mutus]|uniref:Protein FAM92A1 n=1 Tax=Bos mutus TaxID=72004 RepID=A0A6B0R1T3_9CETA|nr:hypothetical protein [Bos mutus]